MYPASAQRCCGRSESGSGRASTVRSRVGSSNFTSCTLAPLATSDSGTPRASTSKLRLRPFFSPVRGVRSHAFDRQGSFSGGPVDALPLPRDALHPVVFGQPRLPQMEKEPRPLPVLKMPMHRAGAAILFGQGLPLAAGAQNVHHGGEDAPRRHRLTPRSRLAPIPPARLPLLDGNQGFHLRPQFVRYRPRLDLCHPARYLLPTCTLCFQLFARAYQVRHYLRISS